MARRESPRSPRARRARGGVRAGWVAAGALVVLSGCAGGAPASDTALGSAGTAAGSSIPAPIGGSVPSTAGTVVEPPATAAVSTSSSVAPDAVSPTVALPPAFAPTDAAMVERLGRAGLAGGAVVVVRDGRELFARTYGPVGRDTPMAVASASKALTATVILSLVDEGVLGLDEPIRRWLPGFGEDGGAMTLRQLLSHTSGIGFDDCIWDLSGVLAACVDRLATARRDFAPGTAFAYGNASYHVAARVAEVATGSDFQTLFAGRVAAPLGMTRTRWSPGATRNPSPAAGARTTVEDYGRFLEMLLAGGTARDGRRVLTPASVAELERDQVVGQDTSGDAAVHITRIPTYGLGVWRDIVDAADQPLVVSGNGALGFYPWIDRRTNSYGIVAVEDQRGAEVAVPASRRVVDAAIAGVGP